MREDDETKKRNSWLAFDTLLSSGEERTRAEKTFRLL